jgi:hypothetical protein
MYIYTHAHTHTHIHIWMRGDLCKILLLLNNSVIETFLHTPGKMCSVDWLFIVGLLAWQ